MDEMTAKTKIEEMAKVKIGGILEKVNMGDGYADIDSLAHEIYHIAIPEGAVVLTKEEYEKLEALKGDYVKGYEAGVDEGWDVASHVTAEKFAERLKTECFDGGIDEKWVTVSFSRLDEICKEIIGGKDDDTSQAGK